MPHQLVACVVLEEDIYQYASSRFSSVIHSGKYPKYQMVSSGLQDYLDSHVYVITHTHMQAHNHSPKIIYILSTEKILEALICFSVFQISLKIS